MLSDALAAQFLKIVADFMVIVVVGAILPGFVLGICATLAARPVCAWAVGKVRSWWNRDTPERLGIKAIVACSRVPLPLRRAVVRGLKTLWGEGPFREIPQAPPPKAQPKPEAKPAPKPEDGVFTVHPAHGTQC